jgi:Uma2 family endonuclease
MLVIEVADASAEIDRSDTVPLYGRSGIAEVWVVDLSQGLVDVHRQASPDGYGDPGPYHLEIRDTEDSRSRRIARAACVTARERSRE